jgi:hypothetical protein
MMISTPHWITGTDRGMVSSRLKKNIPSREMSTARVTALVIMTRSARDA